MYASPQIKMDSLTVDNAGFAALNQAGLLENCLVNNTQSGKKYLAQYVDGKIALVLIATGVYDDYVRYYDATNGSDDNDGLTLLTAWRTLKPLIENPPVFWTGKNRNYFAAGAYTLTDAALMIGGPSKTTFEAEFMNFIGLENNLISSGAVVGAPIDGTHFTYSGLGTDDSLRGRVISVKSGPNSGALLNVRSFVGVVLELDARARFPFTDGDLIEIIEPVAIIDVIGAEIDGLHGPSNSVLINAMMKYRVTGGFNTNGLSFGGGANELQIGTADEAAAVFLFQSVWDGSFNPLPADVIINGTTVANKNNRSTFYVHGDRANTPDNVGGSLNIADDTHYTPQWQIADDVVFLIGRHSRFNIQGSYFRRGAVLVGNLCEATASHTTGSDTVFADTDPSLLYHFESGDLPAPTDGAAIKVGQTGRAILGDTDIRGTLSQLVTVVARLPAAAADLLVFVDALDAAIPSQTLLDFGSGNNATLTEPAIAGALFLVIGGGVVGAIAAGDDAVTTVGGHALVVSGGYASLNDNCTSSVDNAGFGLVCKDGGKIGFSGGFRVVAVAPGVLAGGFSVNVAPLVAALPTGTVLQFTDNGVPTGSGVMTAPAARGAVVVAVTALSANVDPGNSADGVLSATAPAFIGATGDVLRGQQAGLGPDAITYAAITGSAYHATVADPSGVGSSVFQIT